MTFILFSFMEISSVPCVQESTNFEKVYLQAGFLLLETPTNSMTSIFSINIHELDSMSMHTNVDEVELFDLKSFYL